MRDSISIEEFIRAIEQLPEDEPNDDPDVWYATEKEHWLGWLSEYDGPGAYGRKGGAKRDAKYAFNHVVNPEMLIWLSEAAGVNLDAVDQEHTVALNRLLDEGAPMQQISAAIRRAFPWEKVAAALWRDDAA